MHAAVISEKGRRPEMEDAHNLDLDFGGRGWILGGVYDGHNGRYAAEYTARNLPRIFLADINDGRPSLESFADCYERISSDLSKQESGTTAVNFLIRDGKIYTANAGDARVVIVNEHSALQLSADHRVDNLEERERIEKAGGIISGRYVAYQGARLMPTRTIGDELFKTAGVIAAPSLNEYTINRNDEFLIAACDGLFDFLNNDEVAVMARRTVGLNALLTALKNEVLNKRYGTDNLTIIAVQLYS